MCNAPTRALLLLLALLASCSNYEFCRARTSTGEVDYAKLIQDLETSGEESLSEGLWIPLIYLNLTTFKKSDSGYPKGYTMMHLRAAAPVFCVGGAELDIVDEQGARIEEQDYRWLGWGVLYHGEDGRIETPSGPRLTHSRHVLLALGRDDVTYKSNQSPPPIEPAVEPAVEPAKQ